MPDQGDNVFIKPRLSIRYRLQIIAGRHSREKSSRDCRPGTSQISLFTWTKPLNRSSPAVYIFPILLIRIMHCEYGY